MGARNAVCFVHCLRREIYQMSFSMCLKNYPNVHKFISIKLFEWGESMAFSLINISNIYRFFLLILRCAVFRQYLQFYFFTLKKTRLFFFILSLISYTESIYRFADQ